MVKHDYLLQETKSRHYICTIHHTATKWEAAPLNVRIHDEKRFISSSTQNGRSKPPSSSLPERAPKRGHICNSSTWQQQQRHHQQQPWSKQWNREECRFVTHHLWTVSAVTAFHESIIRVNCHRTRQRNACWTLTKLGLSWTTNHTRRSESV